MTKEEDFKLLKIQTCILKVNIHGDGCKQKVKKLHQRIEGVYQVQIDAEQQKVTVLGSVDYAALIKKLIRSGKYAELWSEKPNPNQKQKNNYNSVKDDKNKGQKQGLLKGLEAAFKNQQQHKFPAFSSEEDNEYCDYDNEDDEDEDEEMRFSREKANQLQMLRQQAVGANNVKKAIQARSNNGNKMGNSGNNANCGNSNGMGGFPVQSNNMIKGNSSADAIPNSGYEPSMLMNMNGFNNHPYPSPTMMNMNMMQTRQAMQQQPQKMYNREHNPTMKPLSFHVFWFMFLVFPILLSVSPVSAETGLFRHPTPRAATEDPLVLAANRTKRPDILRGFQRYRGGWDFANHHYWASVGFTGGAGFILAVLWFISFGLILSVHLCCGLGINFTDHESNHSQRICLMLLLLFTFAAAMGCVLVFVGQDKFHGEALDILHSVVNESHHTVEILKNVTDYLSLAKTIEVARILLPSHVKDDIDKLNVDLNRARDTLSKKTNENAVKYGRVFKHARLGLFVVVAWILLLAVTVLVLSFLGYQHATLVFVIILWLLVATTFILCGVFMILDNAISDTCMATGEWVANPHRETTLTHVLPCVDQKITNKTLIQSKKVANLIATMLNQFIYVTANANANTTQGFLGFYNQSGPFMMPLCIPFDAQFQERPCTDLEVSSANASMVWKKNECEVSESGICTTVGRVTPFIYAQLVAALNGSYALEHYAPLLLSLQNCKLFRDAITRITSSHCPPLSYYVKITSVGLGLISAGILLGLVLWIIYANRPKGEEESNADSEV